MINEVPPACTLPLRLLDAGAAGCGCCSRRPRPAELCATHAAAWPAYRRAGLSVPLFLQACSLPLSTSSLASTLAPMLDHARRHPQLWQPAELEDWLWTRVAANSRRVGETLVVASPPQLAAAYLLPPTSDRTPELRFRQRRELGRAWLPLRAALGATDRRVLLLPWLGYRWLGFDGPLAALDKRLRHQRPASAADHWPGPGTSLHRVDAAVAWRGSTSATSTRSLLRRVGDVPLRVPGSLDGYLRYGFTGDEARHWHQLLDRHADLVGLAPGEATLRTARAWRAAGFDPDSAEAWLQPAADGGELPAPLARLGPRLARQSAAFRAVGFRDLEEAMPYLSLATRHPSLTPLTLFEQRQAGTPLEWIERWAA